MQITINFHVLSFLYAKKQVNYFFVCLFVFFAYGCFFFKFGKMGKNREIRSFLSGLKFTKIAQNGLTSSLLSGLVSVKMCKS